MASAAETVAAMAADGTLTEAEALQTLGIFAREYVTRLAALDGKAVRRAS